MLPIEECRRVVLNHSTHSAVASSTSARLRQDPRGLISSVLYRPICDSISALSSASPTVPIEASIPAVIRWAVKRKQVYWVDSTGRRNTLIVEVLDGTAGRVGHSGHRTSGDAFAGTASDSAGCGTHLLEKDRRGVDQRGRSNRVWCVGPGRIEVVSQQWR